MENQNQNVKVIVFALANEEYAIPVDSVGAIERMQSITRIPDTPFYIKGVLNLRGVIIPIIDLRLRFGMEEAELTDESRIIIVHSDDTEVGIIVDAANDVIDIPRDTIEPPPEVIDSIHVDYILGVSKIDERLFVLLKLDEVLAKQNDQALGIEG